jgi:hypothetical protein
MTDTINNIMKNHEPWTVGISTVISPIGLFFPVYYNKKKDLWYGYYRYQPSAPERIPGSWPVGLFDNIESWRKGSRRNYYIHITDGIKLPPNSSIHIFIKAWKV